MADPLTNTIDALTHMRPSSSKTTVRPSVFSFGELLADCYEIREVLGAGGMGQVFAALDRGLDRQVAIKGAYPGHGETIRREARALAALRHPSMVTVHAVGRHRDVDYMVMERIHGTSLHGILSRSILEGERIRIEQALEILIGLADALVAVHENGLAHLDLKPSNIMVAARGRIVLMDFGVSEAECVAPPEDARPAGTVPYMAPEVILGQAQRGMQHLADVYALGVMGYQLLTNHLPYEGPDASVLEQHVHSPIPNVKDLRPDTPEALADLLRRLMAKQPGDRTNTTEEVLAALRRIRPELPLEERRRWSVLIIDDDERLVRTLRRIVLDVDPAAEVRHAADAELGLAELRRELPALILLDLNMPRMNGLELCMWLSGAYTFEQCPTILMSATATDEVVTLARQLGVYAFIDKNVQLFDQVEEQLAVLRSRWGRRRSLEPAGGRITSPTVGM